MARKSNENLTLDEYVAAVKKIATKQMALTPPDADWLFAQPTMWSTLLAGFNDKKSAGQVWQGVCSGLAKAWIDHNRGAK